MDEIETGNFNKQPSQRGWRVGHFVEGHPNFKTSFTELQWRFDIKAGDSKVQPAYNRKSSTLTVLIKGEMTLTFPHENKSLTLKDQGDYAFFAAGVCHTWKVSKDSQMIGIRWPSIEGDQIACDH